MHRKSAIRLLSNRPARYQKHSGPMVIYGEDFHRVLVTCWHATNKICAERLQPFLPALVSKLERLGEL